MQLEDEKGAAVSATVDIAKLSSLHLRAGRNEHVVLVVVS
jgi:hypothetical protein